MPPVIFLNEQRRVNEDKRVASKVQRTIDIAERLIVPLQGIWGEGARRSEPLREEGSKNG
jgi:hypothetical protein